MAQRRPVVTIAFAQSVDGSLAAKPGQPLPLSGPESAAYTHRLRAAHDAILVGIGTVLSDNPRLTVRLADGAHPQPIVLDSRLRFPDDAALLAHPTHRVWIATTSAAPSERHAALRAAGAELLLLPTESAGRVSLPGLLDELGARGVQRLMVEGGAAVITAFLSHGLADRLSVTVAPRLVGGVRACRALSACGFAHRYGVFGPGCHPRGAPVRPGGPMIRQSLWFDAPRSVSIREESLPAPAAGEVQVRTHASAISPGTEMLIYRGEFPEGMAADESIAALGGALAYPLKYGYSTVGQVEALGAGVAPEWLGRRVFAFHPHESHFIASTADLLAVPAGIALEDALFLPNTETAVNFLLDGAPLIGEQVAVFGQGVVGLLATALLARLPLGNLITFDRLANRRAVSLAMGAGESLDPFDAGAPSELRARLNTGGFDGADLVYELSGAPHALDQAIATAGFSGRVVVGSWYGRKRATLDLGGRFHRARIRLISSQVSTLTPELHGRWTKARRMSVAWDRLRELRPAQLITHRYPFVRAAEAYTQVDLRPAETLQVILTHAA